MMYFRRRRVGCSYSRWKVVCLKCSKVPLCLALVIFINTQSGHLILTEDNTPSSQPQERNDTLNVKVRYVCMHD